MANEESNIGGVGRLLGTASLQKSLDTLNKSVAALTGAVKSGGGKAAGAVGNTALGGWAKKDWNSESNYAHGKQNGGGSTPPLPQQRGDRYTNTLLRGDASGGSGGFGRSDVGNGGHSKIRGVGRAAVAGAGYLTLSGASQLNDRIVMNTATSMIDRTAVNGSGSRSMFQKNYTSQGAGDIVGAQRTVQGMGFSYGTKGYGSVSNYNRTAGLIDPTISQTQAAGASAQLQTGASFNQLRMFGISTIGPGGKPMSPRELAHQFITKDFGANRPKTAAGIEASLGQASRFGQSLSAMVSKGMLDANTASQVTANMRAELNAGLKGKSYGQYASILDTYANKNSTSKAGTTALASIGLTPTDANKAMAQQGNKLNQLDANNEAFSTGLGAATTALGQFSNALTGILSGPLGAGLGVGQGFMGGGVGGAVGQVGGGLGSIATAYGASRAVRAGWGAAGGAGAARGIGGSLGKFSAKGVGLGAVGAVAGNVAGGLIKDGQGGARDKWGGALSGAASGAGIGAMAGLVGGPLAPISAPVGAAIGGAIGGAIGYFSSGDGIAGGAAAGNDKPSGAAAKATGTVGAGKTASNVIAIAKRYLGIPYKYGGKTPQEGFDCSGFTQYVFKQAGITLPRVSGAQQTAGRPVSKKDAQPGDLVFMGGNAKTGGAYHVAIMISSSQIIEAAKTGTNVRIRSFSMDEFSTVGRFLGSQGKMTNDATANTDGQSSSSGSASASSATSGLLSASFTGGVNEMDTLAGTLSSFIGGNTVSPTGKSSTAGTAVTADSSGGDGSGGGGGGNGSVTLSGGSGNAQKVFSTLVGQGYSAQAAAGIIGNLMQESGVNPKSNQKGGPGRGIMQWTENARWATLKKWAGKRDPWSLDTQVGFMLKELNDSGTSKTLKGMTDVNKATDYFEQKMERAGTPNMSNRYKYANAAFNQQKGYAVGSTNIDVDQNARIHKGEMIIPAYQAEGVRQALAGNSAIASISKSGGGGVRVTFSKDSIRVSLGAGATNNMGAQVGRTIVDTIVNDKRLASIARGA